MESEAKHLNINEVYSSKGSLDLPVPPEGMFYGRFFKIPILLPTDEQERRQVLLGQQQRKLELDAALIRARRVCEVTEGRKLFRNEMIE